MFQSKPKILLIKEEEIYGTDPTPLVAANAIEGFNIKTSYVGDVLERNGARNNLSPLEPVIGQRQINVSFDVELKGGGTKGTACKLGDLLEACGMVEVASAGSSVTYTPSTGVMKSVTIYVYDLQDTGSAILHKITGARGDFSMDMSAGNIVKMSYKFSGIYNAPTTVAVPTTPTYETTKPPIMESGSFTLNSVSTLIVQQLELSMGVDLQKSDDISSAGGVKAFNIVGRKPTGRFAPEAVLAATYDFFGDWTGATARALSVVVGSAAGNKVTITAPKVTLDNVDIGDRNGVETFEIPFRLAQSTGNDEIQFKFE